MALSQALTSQITEFLTSEIRKKLADRKTRSNQMPFHTRLLGAERRAVFSFVQSINTTLGQIFFEKTAAMIAQTRFKQVSSQYGGLGNVISADAQRVIQSLIDDLANGRVSPNKVAETKQILAVVRSGKMNKTETPLVDLFLESNEGDEYYIEMKTPTPNKEGFKGFKKMLLDWVALRGQVNPAAKIHTILALTYNPNEPEPYQWMTSRKLLDGKNDLLVGEEFWDFLGGAHTYQDLLDIFEQVGIALRPEIDARFAKLK